MRIVYPRGSVIVPCEETGSLTQRDKMNYQLEKLTAKVAAVNRANEHAAKLHTILHARFAPLVGEKILKADGSLLAKYIDLVPKDDDDIRVFRMSSTYSLAWTVKTCEHMSDSCLYHQTAVYVGNLDGNRLSNLLDFEERRSDFTVDEILEKRAAYESAKRLVDEIKGGLFPFGENGYND